jgi:cysteine desulfurase
LVYLDNSATTPQAPEVTERMEAVERTIHANPSSVHRSGQRARVELEDARELIAAALGAEGREIVLTSGGTEANNHALKGYALAIHAGQRRWPTIITSKSEHHAVIHPAEFLERLGATLIWIDPDAEGRITPEALGAALAKVPSGTPTLVSIMHANNETGTINPIAALAERTHAAGAVLHTDAVQSFGKIPFTTAELGADLISISAHKIHGPKGIGALYIDREIELEPLLHGGAQERNRRGGTEALPLVAGFAEASRLATEGMEVHGDHMRRLSAMLRERLERIEGAHIVTPATGALPNIVNLTFDDAERLDGEGLIVGMDIRGIAVSNGSACTSGSIQPSHVLSAIGLPAAQARAAVRFSLSRYTTAEEIERAVLALEEVLAVMRT